MASTVAATSAVSAAGNSNIQQYDIHWLTPDGTVVGKLIVNFDMGHYVRNINLAKADLKERGKAAAGKEFPLDVWVDGSHEVLSVAEGSVKNGGNWRGEGTLSTGELATLSQPGVTIVVT